MKRTKNTKWPLTVTSWREQGQNECRLFVEGPSEGGVAWVQFSAPNPPETLVLGFASLNPTCKSPPAFSLTLC